MKLLPFVRTFLILAALASGIFAATLSMETLEKVRWLNNLNQMGQMNQPSSIATDSGTTGFAILSGLALVGLGLTFVRKEP